MILAINYDLKKSDKNYDDLYKVIDSASSSCRVMDSLWFVKTDESPQEWADKIINVIDENDYLFVVDIENQSSQGLLPQSVCDWLNDQYSQKDS
jgi:hypothetical protein